MGALHFRLQEYKPVGKVVGRFYDAAGQPTALLARVEAAAAAAAAAKAAAEQKGATGSGSGKQQQQQQPCNVKWSRSEGAVRVGGVGGWLAGGLGRGWVGLVVDSRQGKGLGPHHLLPELA